MDAALAKKWMLLFNEKIQANKDYLSELDTPIGDGDHGGVWGRICRSGRAVPIKVMCR